MTTCIPAGTSQFNYTLGEEPRLGLTDWCDDETLRGHPRNSHDQLMRWGIYAGASVLPGVLR
jgi:hypothetical protein